MRLDALSLRLTSSSLLVLGLVLHGCQQSTHPSAIEPTVAEHQTPQLARPELPLGAYDLQLAIDDAGLPVATVSPLRSILAIGDRYHEVGLTGALKGDVCDCFAVRGLELISPTRVRVRFETRHPFQPALRPDLHAFNLKAHVEVSASQQLGTQRLAPGIVTNADGYSPLWTGQAGTSDTLLPYVIFSRDTTTPAFDFTNPAGWNVFAAGSTHESEIEFELGSATASLGVRLYLTADYGQSATFRTRQTPVYTLPDFAGQAPWRVEVSELSNDLTPGVLGSTATYEVRVWDWGHGAGIGTDVTGGTVFVPGLDFTGTLGPLSGTGKDPAPLIAQATISNDAAAGAGTYWGLVRIQDAATSGTGIQDDLRTPFAQSDYSTWQVFSVAIQEVSAPPSAVISEPCSTQVLVASKLYVFDGTGSSDDLTAPEDLIYEWDFDYDGLQFDVEGTGRRTQHVFPGAGAAMVALRVTDESQQSDIETLPLTVVLPGWRDVRNLTLSAGIESLEQQAGQTDRRVFIDSSGGAHVLFRSPSGSILVGHLGSACAAESFSTTDLQVPRMPGVAQEGNILHLAYPAGPTANTMEYRSFDLATRTVSAPETVVATSALPPPGGGSFSYCRLVQDAGTGYQFLILETAGMDLFSVERPAAGTWSAPILADDRVATGFHSFMGAAVSDGECFVVYMDGAGLSRQGLWLRKAATATAWPARQPIGMPDGPHLCFMLQPGPGDDLIGAYFDNPSGGGALAYYLRWNATAQSWSHARIGNLPQYNFFGQVCLDPLTSEVTLVWENIFQQGVTNRRILAKRFPYDASAAQIGDSVYEVVSEESGVDHNEPAAAFNPGTREVVVVWERDMDPGPGYDSDLFSAVY